MKIIVVGAGVVGLTTAIALLNEGYNVQIIADKDCAQTTSTIAAAIWMPFKLEPEGSALKWAQDSIAAFTQLTQIAASGVVWRTHTEFFTDRVEKSIWMSWLQQRQSTVQHKPANAPYSYSVRLPVIDTVKYIAFLKQQFILLGGTFLPNQHIKSWQQLADFPVVVNCTGLGAKQLAADSAVYPIKGQLVHLEQPDREITKSILFINGDDTTLIVPHEKHVVVGVTVLERDDTLTYDEIEEEKILQRAYQFYPQLENMKVLNRSVGLRPGRDNGVRLSSEKLNNKQLLIHNYGHAGGGITLSPGCAQHVVEIVNQQV